MWNPVETRFFSKQRPIGIIDIACFSQSHTIRTFADDLILAVRFYKIGTPGDFLAILSEEGDSPPLLIVCAHGGDYGIHFGEYGEGIDTSMLKEGNLPPESIAQHANIPDRVIVNACCNGGSEAMAHAFMKGGAKCYIGSRGYQAGISTTLFMALFLDRHLRKGESAEVAWRQAASYDDDTRYFVYYDANGRQAVSS